MDEQKLVLLRYKGGSGGEAMYRWLRTTCLGMEIGTVEEGNYLRNHSPIGGLLQAEWTGDAPAGAVGLPNSRWTDLTPAQIADVIGAETKGTDGMPYILLHAHYVVPGNMFRAALPDAVIIDLMPRRQDMWMCHLMQRRKEFAKKSGEMPEWLRGLPGTDMIESSLRRNGWFPAFWTRMVSDGARVRDLDYFFDGIAVDRKNSDDGLDWHRGSNLMVDARSWLLEENADHHALLDVIGVMPNPDLEEWISLWKKRNRQLMLAAGCTAADLERDDMDVQEQEKLVARLLKPVFERLNDLAL